jgi:hypothetical protein
MRSSASYNRNRRRTDSTDLPYNQLDEYCCPCSPLLFIEHLKLLEIVLRWMVLVKGEPCFILIILIVVVGKFVDIYQILSR